jgi:hypothetical protein
MTAALVAGEFLRARYWNSGFDLEEVSLIVLVSLVVSLVFGAIGWRESEREYQRFVNTSPMVGDRSAGSTPEA